MYLYQSSVELVLVLQYLEHSKLKTTLIYVQADTELKRKAFDKSILEDSPLKKHLNANQYNLTDEETLKQLCGLRG